jgi:hypothetical protein
MFPQLNLVILHPFFFRFTLCIFVFIISCECVFIFEKKSDIYIFNPLFQIIEKLISSRVKASEEPSPIYSCQQPCGHCDCIPTQVNNIVRGENGSEAQLLCLQLTKDRTQEGQGAQGEGEAGGTI